jgi:hypothetical protein
VSVAGGLVSVGGRPVSVGSGLGDGVALGFSVKVGVTVGGRSVLVEVGNSVGDRVGVGVCVVVGVSLGSGDGDCVGRGVRVTNEGS